MSERTQAEWERLRVAPPGTNVEANGDRWVKLDTEEADWAHRMGGMFANTRTGEVMHYSYLVTDKEE